MWRPNGGSCFVKTLEGLLFCFLEFAGGFAMSKSLFMVCN